MFGAMGNFGSDNMPISVSVSPVTNGRRLVLGAVGLALVAGALGALRSTLPSALLTGLSVSRHAALRGIGRRYLAQYPHEADRAVLSRLVGAAQTSASVAQRRASDLAAGDIAIVDGWILTRTEARIAALATLG